MTRLCISGLIVGLSLLLVACSPNEAADSAAAAALSDSTAVQTTPAPTNMPSNAGLVARVNGEPISRDELNTAVARRLQDAPEGNPDALAEQVLQGMIQQKLIEQVAPELGVTVTMEEAAAEVQNLRELVNDDAEWQQFLDMNGYNEDEMLQAQYETLLAQRVQDHLAAHLEGDVPQVHARHIVVRTESKANEVLERLQGGEDFIVLAALYSIDVTTREAGGDLGWFTEDELIDERLADIAMSLEPNQIAGPIPTAIGYHIIQVLEKANRPIEPERMPILRDAVFYTWLQNQERNAQIERFIQ